MFAAGKNVVETDMIVVDSGLSSEGEFCWDIFAY